MSRQHRVITLDTAPPAAPPEVLAAPWHRVKKIPHGTETRWREGDRLHIRRETHVVEEPDEDDEDSGQFSRTIREDRVVPALIPYSKILDGVTIEQDEWCEPPWENCDGYKHELQSEEEFMNGFHPKDQRSYEDVKQLFRNTQGAYYGDDGWTRVVLLDPEDWGIYDYQRAHGASKQVAREMEAAEKRRTIARLVDWHENGWEYWYVTLKFRGFEDSLGGIDDYHYAEHVAQEEMASGAVRHLEADGYIVTGVPERRRYGPHKQWTLLGWRDHLRRNLQSQNWKD